jgi:AcrR family transcriptional regulator
MPRISAPTVKEHRQAVLTKLVDAAEGILRRQGIAALTAGAVTAQAGIARNSIYRYVDSVDDLRGLVLARYLPRWTRAVDERVTPLGEPRLRVLEWVRANLEQASVNGHGWLMEVARSTRLDHGLQMDLEHAHDTQDFLAEGLADLGLVNMPIRAEMIRAVVDAGFRSLDSGENLEDVTHWAMVAVEAIIAASEARGDRPGLGAD